MEFVDLECPFCRRYQATLQRVADQFGSAVSLVFLHYPLDMHRFARPAAQASECAERQGRFREFVEAAYAKQDSFGLKAWVSVAREAGVPDTAGFLRCLEGAPATRIDSARAAGEGIPVRGTPTLVVNGWTFRSPPPESELVRVITELLAGREPFESTVGVVRDGAR